MLFFTETLLAKHSLLFSLAQTDLLHAKRGRLLRKAASLQLTVASCGRAGH